MRDYGLFLKYHEANRLLDQDESVYQTLTEVISSFEETEEGKEANLKDKDKLAKNKSEDRPKTNKNQGFFDRMGKNIAIFKKSV